METKIESDADSVVPQALNSKAIDLTKFRLERILSNNSQSKTICIVGEFVDSGQRAIVIFEKSAFTEENVRTSSESENDNSVSFFASSTELKEVFVNDIYGNFDCIPSAEINSVKTTIISPCTEKHIKKYSSRGVRLVQETALLYRTVTEPRLEREQFNLDWVYNILDHKKETDRIIFEDPCDDKGFILLPDLKWDGKTQNTFYAVAIVRRRDLKSIRSLTGDHLELLRNLRDKGVAAIEQRFKLRRSELRIYFHYQPSFHHLHAHFTYLNYNAPGIFCEKSHLLDTVISNVELMPDYYQRATLSFVLDESSPLLPSYLADSEQFAEEADVAEPAPKKVKLNP